MQIHSVTDPQAVIREHRDGLLALAFAHNRYYQPGASPVELLAVVSAQSAELLVLPRTERATRAIENAIAEDGMGPLAEALGAPRLRLDRPLPLVPIAIPKPWGQEIWYTGIEARGQSRVGEEGASVPLPWVLDLAGDQLTGGGELTLLKILDPLPDEVYGDLYFEMHERKQEVYVVTHIDQTAWPNGQGGIRFGFCPQKRARYPDDQSFRQAYLEAVKAYEAVRREIDGSLDERKQQAGLPLDAPLAPGRQRRWLADLAPALTERERRLREQMDSFARTLPLTVGDVVQVPCHTPHSLLHGVRTVEFQTPVYERQILSFAQKVLTQPHWDTEQALDRVSLEAPPAHSVAVLDADEALVIERIVDFDSFEVLRLKANADTAFRLKPAEHYRLAMGVAGQMQLGDRPLPAEAARLIGARTPDTELTMAAGSVALLASPRCH